MARHYNNIAVMDQQVGEILAQLETDGLADSTIVIWTTDHGDGLPRAKRDLFDLGIKVPMVIRWPEAYRPEGVAPNGIDTRMVSFIDFAPTILRLAGAPLPDYLQGQDFVEDEPREYIFASRDRISLQVHPQLVPGATRRPSSGLSGQHGHDAGTVGDAGCRTTERGAAAVVRGTG
jgi:arylsulfatase A-like enzyme